MKYIILLAILTSCKSEPRKVVATHNEKDTVDQKSVKSSSTSVDLHDPFQTGKDTIRLNKAMDKIFKFPEVQDINNQIDRNSHGKHGVSFMVTDNFDGDTSYYLFEVGDNSHDRYMNIYDFLLEKKTGQIKAYDQLSDSIMTLKEWRKARNRN
jgi:hypothetical protein